MNKRLYEITGRIFPYVITAAISCLIVIILFITKGIAPFGENSVLSLDLWGQYFPMYVNNKQAIGISGLMYSWNGAFGFNNWVQSAYYCNSIFLLLFKFIPIHNLVKALDIFCLIKIVLSSVSCLAFLNHKIDRKSPVLIAGAVSYSLCAYTLAYLSQFMWTDCMIYAPLVLIGIERLIHEKKPIFYTVILAVSIISSFYIGFVICIFSVLYYICNSIPLLRFSIENRRLHMSGGKAFIISAVRFGVFSLLAGAISAIVIIPVGIAISQTLAVGNQSPEEFEWYGNITAVLQYMLPNQRLFLEYEGANLFTGQAAFIAVPVYFFNNRIRLTERIANAFMGIFLLASLNCNILDYFWHGFHFPNQLPARWTFLFSLFIVMISCKGLAMMDKLTPYKAISGCAVGAVVFYVTALGVGETPKFDLSSGAWISLVIISLMIILGSIAVYFIKDKADEDGKPAFMKYVFNKSTATLCFATVIAAVMIIDSEVNLINVSQYEGMRGLRVSLEESYTNLLEKSSRNGLMWNSGEDDFYRVEANNGHTFNSSMIGNYHGMRYYSSTMNGDVFKLLRFLGNRVYAENVSSVYRLDSPVQNSLFAIKYFMDFDRYLNDVIPGMTLVEENEDGDFYENPTVLSLAYAVSDDVLQYTVTDEVRGIKNQNDLVNQMCGEEINPYKYIECSSFSSENVYFDPNENWNENYFINESGDPQSLFHFTYEITEDGEFYMEHNFRAGTIHINGSNLDKNITPGDGKFAYVGHLNAGDILNIDVTLENIIIGCFGLNLYRFDNEAWNYAYNTLSSQQLQVTKFDNTKVEGTITLKEESLVFSSIPQDGGWDVYCDGEKIPTQTVADAILCVKIPEGEHIITFRYHVPGMGIGFIISLIGVLAVLLYGFTNAKKSCPLLKKLLTQKN